MLKEPEFSPEVCHELGLGQWISSRQFVFAESFPTVWEVFKTVGTAVVDFSWAEDLTYVCVMRLCETSIK